MAHKEYNVGYRDEDDRLRLAFATPTHKSQAEKRLTKIDKLGGVVDAVFDEETGKMTGKVKRAAFLISRKIPDWEVDAQ